MYRQGDILLIKQAGMPPTDGLPANTLDIIKSSVTGHAHTLTRGLIWFLNDNWNPQNYAVIQLPEGGADLIHPEHKTIKLPGGTYKVKRQREVTGLVED